MTSSSSPATRAEWIALAALWTFTACAVAGYGWFGLNPGRLPETGFALRLYNVSFQFFAQLQILLALAVLAWPLLGRIGIRIAAPFAAIYLISFFSEHMGTGYGIPFGGYAYTGLLGARLGPRVPMLIPVSWFLMAVPAWILARHALGRDGGRIARVVVGSAWLVVWDLALDPAMSFLTPYWRWLETGPYYGMPWMNLAGWFATGVVLMTVLEWSAPRVGLDRLSFPWMVGYFGAMLLMPIGMLVAAGEWLGVGVTAVAAALLWSGSLAWARVGAGARLAMSDGAREAAVERAHAPSTDSVTA